MEYEFREYSSSEFLKDPVFQSTNFNLFGNPTMPGSPRLFYARIFGKEYRYCFARWVELKGNELLLQKIKCYLYFHPTMADDESITYFIGNIEICSEASRNFINQKVQIVTYEMIDQWYPKNIEDIASKVINFLLDNQLYLGQKFELSNEDILFFAQGKNIEGYELIEYEEYILNYLLECEYLKDVTEGFDMKKYVLTSKAIKEFTSKVGINRNSKTAFIAIKFDKNEKRIEAISNAITKAGFNPVVMKNVETNNWIMPEIFKYIKDSRFVVADFSKPCEGAYYEAGYAAALGKPVIHLFDKNEQTENNKLHFDIAQKSTIFYDSFDDLNTRLVNRIKATII